MKKVHIAAAALAALIGLSACGQPEQHQWQRVPAPSATPSVTDAGKAAGKAVQSAAPKKTTPAMTGEQRNAVKKAADYLDGDFFSKKSLTEQLEYEGFSKSDSAFAVAHINVDWNVEAAGKAKDYLRDQAFSKKGLLDQLEYEGFTASQAKYGVAHSGL